MLKQAKNFSASNLSIICIGIVLIFIASNTNWGKNKWQNTIESDAKGYYAYNPAIFIYHDLNFQFFREIEQEKYYQEHLFVDYRSFLDEGVVNKYYAGTALAQMPFFLIAHGIAHLTDYDADGYSKIYMQFINIAAIFYCLFGLIFLNKTLNFYSIKEFSKVLISIIAVFGTNLFIYTIAEPGMSHVYSFAFVSLFIYLGHLFYHKKRQNALPLMGLVLGLICLIRPVNGLIIFSLFFVSGLNPIEFFKFTFKPIVKILFALLLFSLVAGIQPLIYYISIDTFWVNSYQDEGFNFLSPHFIDILISYKKGLFLYTPIYLVSFVGLIYLKKENILKSIYWVLFFLLITYIFSSWWMWFYGGSFSSRVYVEFIPLFMILLAIALERIPKGLFRLSFITFCFLLVVLCQIQSYQYRYYILHYSEMTQEKYWDVFLSLPNH